MLAQRSETINFANSFGSFGYNNSFILKNAFSLVKSRHKVVTLFMGAIGNRSMATILQDGEALFAITWHQLPGAAPKSIIFELGIFISLTILGNLSKIWINLKADLARKP